MIFGRGMRRVPLSLVCWNAIGRRCCGLRQYLGSHQNSEEKIVRLFGEKFSGCIAFLKSQIKSHDDDDGERFVV